MKVKIDKSRRVYKGTSNSGRINENKYEVLEFEFPQELEDFTKYIEIEATNDEGTLRYVDRIENNEFVINNTLSKYSLITAQIICKDLKENVVFKSAMFELNFDESLNILEDFEEEQKDLLDRIELELQEAKEDIQEINTKIETLQGRVGTNETDISTLKTDVLAIQEEQTTQNNNIASNTNKIALLEHDSGNKVALSINSDYVMTLQLLNKANEVLSTGTIDLPIESMIVNASYSNGILTLTLQNGQTLNVDISDIVSGLVSETTFNNAISELQSAITALQERMTTAETNIANKVDKVAGKGLSTEDYTTAEKNKLANLENYDDTEVKADIQENTDNIQALETKHNTEVAELNEKITELQTDLEMATDIIPTGDATGSDITINDSARYYFKKMVLGGKSEQETFTGKNFANINNIKTSSMMKLENNNIILQNNNSQNGYNTTNITLAQLCPSLKIGDNVELSFNTTSSMTAKNIIYFSGASDSWAKGTKKTITQAMLDSTVVLYGGYNEVATISEFMISTEGGDYEPYTGGQPAPNPGYECPIQNVGDNVNLNSSEMELGSLNDSGQLVNDTQTIRSKNYINIKGNTVYTINNDLNCNLFILFYDENYNYLSINNIQVIPKTFTSPANAKYIKVRTRQTENITDTSIKIKLEKGDKATPYSPYNCGNVEVKVNSQNICTNVEVDQGKNNIIFYADVKLIKQTFNIAFTTNTALAGNSLYCSVDGQNLGLIKAITATANSKVNESITLSNEIYEKIKNATSLNFRIYKTNAGFVLPDDAQISNETITSYVPHEEQTAIFPLEEGQRLHKDDAIRDKIVQKRKTVVFDGIENWLMSTNNNVYRYIISLPDRKEKGNGLSNYFKTTNSTSNEGLYNGISANFITREITTVAAWKAWVAEKYANGTPLTLEYELETPLEIPFTQAQATAKAQIDKLYSYKGTTHITSNADLDVTYRKDQDLENKNLQAQIDELKTSILSLGGNV